MRRLILLLVLSASAVMAQNDYTTTPNLSLKLPNYGSVNWGAYTNQDFQILDAIVGVYHGGFYSIPFNTTLAMNLANGNTQFVTLSSNVTSSTLLASGVTSGQIFYLIACQNATGGYVLPFPPTFQTSPAIASAPLACTTSAWIWVASLSQWVNVGTSSSGGGGGTSITLQTNNANNASQAILNFLTSTTNATGLTNTPSNPSAGGELIEITGTLNAGFGGTGRTLLTAHSVVLGNGTGVVNLAAPGSASTCLVSNGTTLDPTFQSCPTAAGITLPLSVSGTAVSGGVLYLNSTTQVSSSALLASGQFVLGGGAGGAPSTTFSIVPAANGGTGTASPTAHQLPIAEGSSAFTFITPSTGGFCLLSNGTSADPSFQACPSASPAGATNALQYNGGGGAFAALTPQATNGVYQVIENVVAGVSVAPSLALGGVLTNPQTGTTYIYGSAFTNADRFGYTTFSNAGAIAVSLPQAGSGQFISNWGNLSCDIGAGTATITPTTSTISYTLGASYTSGASTMTLATGECAWIFTDNTNYFAVKRAAAGSGTVTHTAGALTAGRLLIGNGSADITVGDLSGAITTSGSTATSITAGAVGATQLSTSQQTRTATITDLAPVVTDSGLILVIDPATSIHITRIYGSIQGATNAVLNLDKRTEATIGTDSGAHLLGSDLTAVTGGANTSTFANGSSQCGGTSSCAIAAHAPVVLTLTSVSGSPTSLTISVDYQVDN